MKLERAGVLKRYQDSFIVTGTINSKLQEEQLFNGLTFYNKVEIFYNRLLLLIQTLTNTKYQSYSFIPVVEDKEAEIWVKKVYKKVKGKEKDVLKKLYLELYEVLSRVKAVEVGIFVDRLTGYKHYGMSVPQLGEKYKKSVDDVQLILVCTIHQIIENVEKEEKTSLLAFLLQDTLEVSHLTKSAYDTYLLLLKGKTPDKIAFVRRLKTNTIYDHIVEIALSDSEFAIEDFVNQEDEQAITQAITSTNSYKLKDIKANVNDKISYFQIRLVLAKKNRLHK
ncbi:helix-turn-helix domain-containing protein [Oceanobacillus piezotolerans]|uniref:helix-turn-helix domain-containing protein n=1 Tax=Oceanobacillus piezotolerans TaxID=2448030 RepID=UPI001314650A|nr:helix-turn-helix domain-containing protein [Oceanobacillus piezotolerans]